MLDKVIVDYKELEVLNFRPPVPTDHWVTDCGILVSPGNTVFSSAYPRLIVRPITPSAPPEPKYVPFSWETREELRGRWVRHKTEKVEFLIDEIDGHGAVWCWETLLNDYRFLDTGKPVGIEVLP